MPSGRSASCLSSARALSTFRLITAKRTNPSDLTSGGFEHFKVGAPSGMSACGWRRPLSLRRFAPCVLRWKTLRVSSAPHPVGFESRRMGSKKPATARVTGSSIQMVPPAGFEPAISTLKGWRPWPLDDGDSGKKYSRLFLSVHISLAD